MIYLPTSHVSKCTPCVWVLTRWFDNHRMCLGSHVVTSGPCLVPNNFLNKLLHIEPSTIELALQTPHTTVVTHDKLQVLSTNRTSM